MKRLATAAAGLGALAVLAGCGNVAKDRGICPRVAILGDTAKVTKFRPGAPETAENVMFTGEMRDIKITCRYTEKTLAVMEADVFVTMIMKKGPAMQGEIAEVPYFVSVTDRRGTVLNKREFPLRINFSGNAAVEHTEKSWQYYRLRRGYGGIEYETWVGFQLDDGQLEYNRRTAAQ